MKELPFAIDEETILMKPFSLKEWLQTIGCVSGCKQLFKGHYQFDIKVKTGQNITVCILQKFIHFLFICLGLL